MFSPSTLALSRDDEVRRAVPRSFVHARERNADPLTTALIYSFIINLPSSSLS
jgi:hypothetical protein